MKPVTTSSVLVSLAIALTASACGSSGPTAGAAHAPATTTTIGRPSQEIDEIVATRNGRMHIRCVGHGAPTVLLVAGWGDGGENWGRIEPAVSEHARVCSYARFGTGTSDAPATTQTFATQAADLYVLLRSAGEPGPYVVLGHSFGGAEAVTFAAALDALGPLPGGCK